jgi:methyl-accepting chemotaxis protein
MGSQERLLPNLSVGRKMALLLGLFLVPTGILAGLLVHEKGLAIDFALEEIKGVAYLRALQGLRNALDSNTDLAAAAAALAEVEDRFGKEMESAKEYQALQDALAQPGHRDVPAAWDALYAQVGDKSDLILDPDLDTYYLMDVVLSRLPLLQDRLGAGMGSMSSGLAAGLRRELSDQAAAIERDLSVAYAQPDNALLKERVAPLFEAWKGSELALAAALGRCEAGSCAGLAKPAAALGLDGKALLAASLDELERLLQRRIHGFRRSRDLTLAIVALLVALCAALAWRLAVSVVRPLQSLSRRLDAIVEKGDLRAMELDPGRDEVGRLSRSLAAVVEQLRGIPRALGQSAELLARAVASLEAETTAQSSVVARQATALQETQVTAEEIRQTSQVASRSAQGVLAGIESVERAGAAGLEALESTLAGLQQILDAAHATAGSIGELGEQAGQIGSITGTVKDLADQSNMLALNAAIEAVRSGEHGKGFALVAREIRRLADQSIQSTERVREILEGVRVAVERARGGSAQEAQTVEASLDQMRLSAEQLRAMASGVRDSSAAVRQIATAISQQDSGVAQVFAAVVDQNKMMEESVRQLEGTLKAVASLKEVSGGLAALLSRYKA